MMNRSTNSGGPHLLCLSVLLTALLLQTASWIRQTRAAEDGLLPPLFDYLHPAALLFLAGAYLISLGLILKGMLGTRR